MQQGFKESPPDNTIRTKMEVGPPKMRRRGTGAPRPINGQCYMTAAQVVTFDTFYDTTLYSGSLRFDWKNPRTGVSKELRFTAPPVYTPMGEGYIVAMSLEIMN
jgi:hypothetical protein